MYMLLQRRELNRTRHWHSRFRITIWQIVQIYKLWSITLNMFYMNQLLHTEKHLRLLALEYLIAIFA